MRSSSSSSERGRGSSRRALREAERREREEYEYEYDDEGRELPLQVQGICAVSVMLLGRIDAQRCEWREEKRERKSRRERERERRAAMTRRHHTTRRRVERAECCERGAQSERVRVSASGEWSGVEWSGAERCVSPLISLLYSRSHSLGTIGTDAHNAHCGDTRAQHSTTLDTIVVHTASTSVSASADMTTARTATTCFAGLLFVQLRSRSEAPARRTGTQTGVLNDV